MKKRIARIIALLSVAFVLFSCAPSRYISISEPVGDLALIGPVAQISYVDGSGQMLESSSLSENSAAVIKKSLQSSSFPISETIDISNSLLRTKYSDEIIGLLGLEARKKDVVPIPQSLDDLLHSYGKRYGIVVLARGFDRDVKNYRKELTKSIVLGVITEIVTLGAVGMISDPQRNILETWIAVLDSENDTVVYFDHKANELSPTNEAHVQKQIERLARKYGKSMSKASGK